MRGIWWTAGVAVAAVLGCLSPAGAVATPVSGPRETLDLTFTSVLPNAPTGYRYRELYRDPANPSGEPPAVRAVTYTGPRGGRIDTLAGPRCMASDDELKQQGERACAPGSQTGTGTTTVSIMGLVRMTGVIDIFNGPAQEVDVVKFGGRVSAIVRNRYTANGFSNIIPTCLTGGQPPDGCRSDQVVVVSTDQSASAVVSGSGRARRSLITNPPVCPRSGFWRSQFDVRFADGTTDHLATRHDCTRPVLTVRLGRDCALRARVTGRDLREVSYVDFFVDGRRFARDPRAPFGARTHVSRRRRHRVIGVVYAHGVRVARLHQPLRCARA